MGAADRSVWFLGDLGDPWVAAIGDALPSDSARISCPGDLPDDWPIGDGPRVVVVHRSFLTPGDADRLSRLRALATPTPRVVVCPGPHARHVDLERWSARGIVDAVVPEATARDTIGRHVEAAGLTEETSTLSRAKGGPVPGPRVAVVSPNGELRWTLADACEALGYPAEPARDWSDAPTAGPAIWDVPVLEPGWPSSLSSRSRRGPRVALVGFADRSVVGGARAGGAAACLELPYDLLDLGHVLDRVASVRGEPAHPVPRPPSAQRRGRTSPGQGRPKVAGGTP